MSSGMNELVVELYPCAFCGWKAHDGLLASRHVPLKLEAHDIHNIQKRLMPSHAFLMLSHLATNAFAISPRMDSSNQPIPVDDSIEHILRGLGARKPVSIATRGWNRTR
jgi:hypothetical protein